MTSVDWEDLGAIATNVCLLAIMGLGVVGGLIGIGVLRQAGPKPSKELIIKGTLTDIVQTACVPRADGLCDYYARLIFKDRASIDVCVPSNINYYVGDYQEMVAELDQEKDRVPKLVRNYCPAELKRQGSLHE